MDHLSHQLATQLQADLVPIVHPSFNRMFTGYSRRWQQVVFVKAFTPERRGKFEIERCVNQQLNDRVLTSWQGPAGEWILVMRDLSVTPLSTPITPALATQMGQVLAHFHQTVSLPVPKTLAVFDFADTEAKIARLPVTPLVGRLTALMSIFERQAGAIKTELGQTKLLGLHGDVSCRNYQFVEGKLQLIDFERAKMGYPQEELQKLFYQDFADQPACRSAFLAGYGALPILSPLTKGWLTFRTAVGIFCYVQAMPDPQFERVGQRMLQAVEHDLT
ncbi:phosphotransferase [Lactiplantibacillus sp. WILCCON 0030]|uniref:Phosphotransferase n=1 Tax=Lactiplantibacillus brownii TaxID=3069269 RepID=A0ABU1AC37_9LACO|nr:phosphotransferase [Lactiplantibacillus brownii]MDQ7938205.1 phosphotransferase [Lactiplantibacillus brownii]